MKDKLSRIDIVAYWSVRMVMIEMWNPHITALSQHCCRQLYHFVFNSEVRTKLQNSLKHQIITMQCTSCHICFLPLTHFLPQPFQSLSVVSVIFLSLESLCNAHLFLCRSKSNPKFPSLFFYFIFCMLHDTITDASLTILHPWLNLISSGDEQLP